MFMYKKRDNVLYEFADDIAARYITAALPIDYSTIACADKFGNFFVGRLPPDISTRVSRPLGRVPPTGRSMHRGPTISGPAMIIILIAMKLLIIIILVETTRGPRGGQVWASALG